MTIVIATDLGFIIQAMNVGASITTAITVIRGIRVLRMFRLLKTSQAIRLVLDTIMNILPQIYTVFGLFMLIIFIYAALGSNLFGTVML